MYMFMCMCTFQKSLIECLLGRCISNLPRRAAFLVAPSAVYLGFALGPNTGAGQWSLVLANFAGHVAAVAFARLPPAVVAFASSSQVVALFAYEAQLLGHCCVALREERHRLCAAFRLPRNSVQA